MVLEFSAAATTPTDLSASGPSGQTLMEVRIAKLAAQEKLPLAEAQTHFLQRRSEICNNLSLISSGIPHDFVFDDLKSILSRIMDAAMYLCSGDFVSLAVFVSSWRNAEASQPYHPTRHLTLSYFKVTLIQRYSVCPPCSRFAVRDAPQSPYPQRQALGGPARLGGDILHSSWPPRRVSTSRARLDAIEFSTRGDQRGVCLGCSNSCGDSSQPHIQCEEG